jgi:fucose 4-O-acetylase-like acetyltransferase
MHNLPDQKSPVDFPSVEYRPAERDVAIDYLRTFVIVLVVFLHAALAYASFSTYDPTRWVEATAPVVDAARWSLLDPVILFLDSFMMPLLFLVSGLFAISSLERKGSRRFFLARLQRLGIPFVITAIFVAPLAFLPGYIRAFPKSATPYLIRFYTSDGWPVGAPWFLWVLLMFNGILALVHRVAPAALARLRRQPTNLVIWLVTVVSFLPFRLVGSQYWWISLGPFDVEPVRLGLYLAYFLLGVALGTGEGWRKPGWPKHWDYWLIAGILSFLTYSVLNDGTMRFSGLVTQALLAITWATSCAGASLGLLGAFRTFARRRYTIVDSLNANSFGIYLIHYPVVHWFQFALLFVFWSAWLKFGVAFIGGTVLSWGISTVLRKIPAVRRVL